MRTLFEKFWVLMKVTPSKTRSDTWCIVCLLFRNSHQRCSRKMAFLKILQNSQENTCVGLSWCLRFRPEACNFTEKETPTQVLSCEFYEIFKNFFFIEKLHVITSGYPVIQLRAKSSFCLIFLKKEQGKTRHRKQEKNKVF